MLIIYCLSTLFNILQNRGLDSAEAEIKIRFVQHRAGKIDRGRIPLQCKAVNQNASRVAEAKKLGHLVIGLPGSIIKSLANGPVLADTINTIKMRMTTRNGESQKGKTWRIFQHRGQDMALHVMDCGQGDIKRPGHSFGS